MPPNFLLKRSTRPAVSTNFCLPVKNGWQLLHISTLILPTVLRVVNVLPQAQWTLQTLVIGVDLFFHGCFLGNSLKVGSSSVAGQISSGKLTVLMPIREQICMG